MTEFAGRHFVPGDRPLRRDLRLLGVQFRDLIVTHGGEDVWRQVHDIRELAERRQQGDPDAEGLIAESLSGLSSARLEVLSRAMGIFFDLANLAEDRHRVRVLGERADQGRGSETIAQGIAALREGTSESGFRSVLSQLNVEPVFTAHPTEAKRRTVRRALRRVRDDLERLDRANLLRAERRRCLARMRADLLALWVTDPISPRRPTVMEELERTIYTVRTLWDAAPRVLADMRAELSESEAAGLRHPLRFGNWIGGDRDGNPFVTCDVTQDTLKELRGTAIKRHRDACRSQRRRLSVSALQGSLPRTLKRAIDQACIRWPQLRARLEPLHPHEWIVQWLTIVDQRLRHSKKLPHVGRHAMAYNSADELAQDVDLVITALRTAGHDELVDGALQRWRDCVGIFGLHLLRLDIRVNSVAVRGAVGALLRASGVEDDYDSLDEADRARLLHETDPDHVDGVPSSYMSADAADLLEVLTLTQQYARAGDTGALGHVIISMTHQPTDVIGVIWLMRAAAHRAGLSAHKAVSVVPLFETIDDLAASADMMDAIVASPLFRDHIDRGERHVTCMIGYSDSAKDGGYMAANWALFEGQKDLAACMRRHKLDLTVFHGRGGALGRGGGPAARAILSLPAEAVKGRLRLTEQGEMVAERYDDPKIASRHLEQLFWATLCQSSPHEDAVPSDGPAFATDFAARSMSAYRALIASPGFEGYLAASTALPLIERLPIGSRPSRRSAAARLEDLRAIPFTFAWNQVRMPINAFYGLGAAFAELDAAAQARAAEFYTEWPWFRAVIDNAELALAQCDVQIARRYAAQADDAEVALAIWEQLRDEYERSLTAVMAIKQETRLIESIPWLRRTIEVRTPYLDMLNLVQMELLSRLADGEVREDADAIEAGLRLTVQAIATGLRTTG